MGSAPRLDPQSENNDLGPPRPPCSQGTLDYPATCHRDASATVPRHVPRVTALTAPSLILKYQWFAQAAPIAGQ
jgi:hypothetical protein